MKQTRVIRVVQNEEGFSLTELLVTSVIIVLVSIIMATGIPSALHAYMEVMDASNAHLLLSTTAIRLRDELSVADPDASKIHISDDKKSIEFESLETHYTIRLAANGAGSGVSNGDSETDNNTESGETDNNSEKSGIWITRSTIGVDSQTESLVPERAWDGTRLSYSGGSRRNTVLYPDFDEIEYNNGVISIKGLSVKDADNPNAVYSEAEFNTYEIRVLASVPQPTAAEQEDSDDPDNPTPGD